jgi:hypothetical protein
MDLIDAFGMREKMDELDITTAWDEVVGPMVARHTVTVRLKEGKLNGYKWTRPHFDTNYSIMREALKEVLNKRAGRTVVQEIVLE